ncbi:MAG: amidohydrolase family protein [Bryobacteraceae bacterium]
MRTGMRLLFAGGLAAMISLPALVAQQIAVRGETVYTAAGAPIKDGVVLVTNGKIERVGPASSVMIPPGYQTLTAKVVTPGLVDAHSTVGLTGYLNMPSDQDQLERSAAVQPELRAIDAYDPRERLIEWVRSFGITTMNTGHSPGTLVSGQTMIVKTIGNTADEAVIVPEAMIAASLGAEGRAETGKSPGTRGKEMAMLRAEFIKAQEALKKSQAKPASDAAKPDASKQESKTPDRDLKQEAFIKILKGELPLLVTADRAQDVMSAIRLAKEFNFKLIIDSCAECGMILAEVKASGYPVILHATMKRAGGETENLSFEDAAKLQAAGIPFALQSGYEAYVPKTRVILFEAAIAAANGLTFDQALASVTINAAKLIGVADRLGSLEAGKDGDLALYDGDPFEYTSHCVGAVINGKAVSSQKR